MTALFFFVNARFERSFQMFASFKKAPYLRVLLNNDVAFDAWPIMEP